MSMQDLTDAFALIEFADDKLKHFVGSRDPALIAAAEAAIGSRFPPTYREFVKRYGAGNFRSFEIYGVIDADFHRGAVPNGIWLTLDERHGGYIPKDLLIVADAGDGAYYCIELRNGKEGRVVLYEPDPSPDEMPRELVANDFGEFLLSQVRAQLERASG